MLLSVKTRQEYLKELGYYTGDIDGKVGPLTKKAYKDLQNDYFTRDKDKDGIYGKNTDILLRSAYNFRDIKNFKLTEFRCGCKAKYCTGYPAVVDRNLVRYMQMMRSNRGKSITVTSGLRCKTHNKKVGGVSNSSHLSGKAADIYMSVVSDTHNGRVGLVDQWVTAYKDTKYAYCNGYMRYNGKKGFVYNSSTMGNACHLNSK